PHRHGGKHMWDWLRRWIIQRMGTKAAVRDTGLAFENIKKLGGSDAICRQVLARIDNDPEMTKHIESVGIREGRFPFDKTVIGFSAINSLMLARRDLVADPSSADAAQRLEIARRVYRYSF